VGCRNNGRVRYLIPHENRRVHPTSRYDGCVSGERQMTDGRNNKALKLETVLLG